MRSVLVLAFAALGCKRSEPVPVDAPPDVPLADGGAAIVAVPGPVASAIPPAKVVPWNAPSGPLSESERALVGTWAATVGDYAARSVFMADKVMFDLRDAGGGVSGIVKAIENDSRIKSSCVWLELFEQRTGIRRECALVNGEPSALDKTDPVTGKKSDLGTTFAWYYDQPAKSVRVRFDADMLVPAVRGGAVSNLRFRVWSLAFGEKSGDGFRMKESFPEHDYEQAAQYVYEIFPGRFLGKP